jgi:predicted aminopeptidase
VLQDERTPPRIRRLLAAIEPVKAFGEKRGGLKPTRNYTEYVGLDRKAAVWVVSACEPLRFKSKEWGFPVVGHFPYLGWFDLEDARRFAQELKQEGWDVDLRGARAYSTLGWFRDAVLSTMIPDGPEALGELVNVVLHESTHATLYLNGQAPFNESIASFVADQLTLEYLEAQGEAAAAERKAYADAEKASEERARKLHAAYGKLAELYASARPDEEKRAEKERVLAELRKELGATREITNATLVQFKTYNTGQEEFRRIFAACGSDWGRFWRAMGRIRGEDFAHSQQEDLPALLGPLAARLKKEGCA